MKCLRCKTVETYNTIYCSKCHEEMKKEKIDKDLLKEMKKERDETGLPISRQINLRLKGYKITKGE